MKARILIIYLIIATKLFSYSNNINNLKLLERIDKEIIDSINIDKTFKTDGNIDLSLIEKKYFDGISISGVVDIKSDSSFVKILLIDSKGHIYQVGEFSPLYCNIGSSIFSDRMDETFLLKEFIPSKIIVQLVDAEIEIKEAKIFVSKEKNSERRRSLQKELQLAVNDAKVNQIRNYINKNNMLWHADHTYLSSMPYSAKAKLYGEKFNLYGFDYYKSGFFSFNESKTEDKSLLKSTGTFVDEFDWRNRHGQNWITPNTCQGGCFINGILDCSYKTASWSDDSIRCVNDGGDFRNVGTCWAFSAVGTLESLVNLYFNRQINYDLSEQQVVSCAYGIAEPWYLSSTLNYIQDNHVVNETCYPYLAADGNCNNTCNNPSDRISFSSNSYISSETDLKVNLISSGPLAAKQAGWSHVLVCVGWGTVKVGDYISYETGTTVQPGDPLIGSTYWVLKQSNIHDGWPYHTGYIYMINKPDYAYRLNLPITSDVYSDSDILCVDNDNDSYYSWGIGPKPSTCPSCAPDEPDGDDSTPYFGPMDGFGNLTALSQPFQHPATIVSSTESWNSNIFSCGDVTVTNTGNLTINGSTIYLNGNSSFQVELGGELLINEGTIE